MAVDLISSIVDRAKVSSQLGDTINELQQLFQAIANNIQAVGLLNTQLGKTTNQREYIRAQEQINQALLKNQQLTERIAQTAAQAEERLRQEKAKTAQQEERLEAQRAARARAEEARQKKALLDVQKQSGAYSQLRQVYAQLTVEAQNAGVQFGVNSYQFRELSQQANGVRARLDAVDQPLGNFQRNVGNYTKGIGDYFSKFYSGIRIAANIIPGLGISGIFLLAFEGLKKLVEYIPQLNFALTESERSANALKEAFKSSIFKDAISNVTDLKNEVKQSKDGFLESEIVVKKYNETIGQTVGQVNSLDEVEQSLTAHAQDYIKSMYFKAAAAAALSQGTDDLIKATQKLQNAEANATLTTTDLNQIRAEIAKGGDNKEFYEGLLKMAENANRVDQESVKKAKTNQDDLVNKTTSTYDKLTQMANKFAKNFINAQSQGIGQRQLNEAIEYNNALLQANIDKNNDIAGDERKSYSARRSALKQSLADQIEVLQNNATKELNVFGLADDQKQSINDKTNAAILKANVDYTKRLRDINGDQAKDAANFYAQKLNNAKSAEEAIINDEKKNYDERLKAVDNFVSTSKTLAKQQADVEIKDAGDNGKRVSTIRLKLQDELTKIQNDGNAKRKQILDQSYEYYTKLINNGRDRDIRAAKSQEETAKRSTETQLQEAQDSANEQLTILAEQYKKGEISQIQYQQKRQDIERATALNLIGIQIDGIEKLLKIEKDAGFDTADQEKKLAELKRQLSKGTADQQISDAERTQAARKKIGELEIDLANQVAELGKAAIDGAYTNQLNRIQDQKDALDDQTAAEIDAVNRSVGSTADKADKIAIINAKSNAQQKQLDQEARRIKHQQAEFDRAFSIAQVIENTAIAVSKAYAEYIFPYSAIVAGIVGALGAAQVATILATPIPAYADGTEFHPGGLARIGEAGKELVIEPGKSPWMTSGDVTRPLARGTQVISNRDLIAATMSLGAVRDREQIPWAELIGAVKQSKSNVNVKPRVNGWGRELSQMERHIQYKAKHFE